MALSLSLSPSPHATIAARTGYIGERDENACGGSHGEGSCSTSTLTPPSSSSSSSLSASPPLAPNTPPHHTTHPGAAGAKLQSEHVVFDEPLDWAKDLHDMLTAFGTKFNDVSGEPTNKKKSVWWRCPLFRQAHRRLRKCPSCRAQDRTTVVCQCVVDLSGVSRSNMLPTHRKHAMSAPPPPPPGVSDPNVAHQWRPSTRWMLNSLAPLGMGATCPLVGHTRVDDGRDGALPKPPSTVRRRWKPSSTALYGDRGWQDGRLRRANFLDVAPSTSRSPSCLLGCLNQSTFLWDVFWIAMGNAEFSRRWVDCFYHPYAEFINAISLEIRSVGLPEPHYVPHVRGIESISGGNTDDQKAIFTVELLVGQWAEHRRPFAKFPALLPSISRLMWWSRQ